MKDFAGSSITYYGLAREKLMGKYPWLISVLVVLALICTTGLAIYLISDLVSFASNPDYKGAGVGLDLNGPENAVPSTANDQEKSGKTGMNSSLNTSLQAKEQNPINQSKANASLLSSQTAKGVVATGGSSSSSSKSSVNEKSGNSPVTRHHSSSSSSSSTSSSASSAKKSGDMNNLTNETAVITIPTNETAVITIPTNETAVITIPTNETAVIPISLNNSLEQESVFSNADSSVSLPQIDVTNSAITSSSDLSGAGQGSILSDEESANSQGPEVATTAVSTSLPSTIVSSTIPAENTPAREPASIIKFKTETTLSPKSELDTSLDNGASTDGASVSDNTNKAKRSKVATKNLKLKATKAKSASSKKSKLTASSQAAKTKEARDKMKVNKDRIAQNMKKKAAQLRSKAAKN